MKNKKMNNIANTSLIIPIATLKNWIDRLDSVELDLNQTIYVKDDIEEVVKNIENQYTEKLNLVNFLTWYVHDTNLTTGVYPINLIVDEYIKYKKK